jgi:hypothetical protein
MKKTKTTFKKRKVTKKRDIERPYCGGEWTKARYFQFIRTALRGASNRWKPKYQCVKFAETAKLTNKKTGRIAMHYQCSMCYNEFPRKEINVDHIVPVGSLNSFEDLPDFTRRLFCERDGLRVLCISCHDVITQDQRKALKFNPQSIAGELSHSPNSDLGI